MRDFETSFEDQESIFWRYLLFFKNLHVKFLKFLKTFLCIWFTLSKNKKESDLNCDESNQKIENLWKETLSSQISESQCKENNYANGTTISELSSDVELIE